jgi:hypothetical protein
MTCWSEHPRCHAKYVPKFLSATATGQVTASWACRLQDGRSAFCQLRAPAAAAISTGKGYDSGLT